VDLLFGRDLEQHDSPFPPVADRLDPQAGAAFKA
jgi:hypothetical protein